MQKKTLDIGCGCSKTHPDVIGVDRVALPGVDVVHDLNSYPWPFESNSINEVNANMVLEHLDSLKAAMAEIHRMLVPGGIVRITVPYYASTVAFQDPTHKNFFTEKTFLYFTKESPLAYYFEFHFEQISLNVHAGSTSRLEKLRCLIPFRSVLKHFMFNMYDEIHVVLKKEVSP